MTTPPYRSPPSGGPILINQSGTASFNSDAISVGNTVWMSFVFTWTGFNTTDATVTIEVSNDGTNWDQKTGATFTIGSAADTQGISLNGVVTEDFYRVAFAHGTNSAGTISCIIACKQ